MKNLFKDIYIITNEIFYCYKENNYNKLKKLINKEKELYDKLDDYSLEHFDRYINKIINNFELQFLEDYEVALIDNQKNLINRRINNKIDQKNSKMISFNINMDFDIIYPNNKILMICPESFLEKSYSELYNKMITNIDIKYLYFIFDSNEISDDKKANIFYNMLFINPYLEDKILEPNINLEEYIKKEDDLYINLWENFEDLYFEYLDEYCINNIKINMASMTNDENFDNNENIIARSIYLRTLFNYLDNETLEEINYNYNNEEREISNLFGHEYVKKAFRRINTDKQIIQKIKTR